MARERRTPDQPVPPDTTPEGGTVTADRPRVRRGTATTPNSPLGRPVVEPIVEQVGEGDDITDVQPEVDYLTDTVWLFDQVHHRMNCPMAAASFEGGPGGPGRGQRMEAHDATEPRTAENPMPRTYRIIACLDCGARARIKLPRED